MLELSPVLSGTAPDAVRIHSKSKKKPPTTFSPGHDVGDGRENQYRGDFEEVQLQHRVSTSSVPYFHVIKFITTISYFSMSDITITFYIKSDIIIISMIIYCTYI